MEALEGKGLLISRTKTEYLQCNFSGTESIREPEVTIGEKLLHVRPSSNIWDR